MNMRSYPLLGNLVLFRQLEKGTLSELWRAGRIENGRIGDTVAVRRFTGGDARALRSAASDAKALVGQIQGSAIVRGQQAGTIDGQAFIEHEYSGGRSLSAVVQRATSSESGPHPIPVDQALAIAERLAASAESLQNIRLGDSRLVHGAIIPQFVWITEDGEVRLGGHLFAKGVLASLKNADVRTEVGPFIAPELRASALPTSAGDVYSIGAILFLTLTGAAPPLQHGEAAIDEARLMFDDEPIPADLTPILHRTLAADPAKRFSSVTELHQAIQKLVAGGRYAPTTFNLAFYLHTLLKKEMEAEARERKEEEAVDVAALLEEQKRRHAAAAAAAEAPAPAAAPEESSAPKLAPLSSPLSGGLPQEPSRSKAPLIAAAVVILAILGGGGYWMMAQKTAAATETVAPPAQASMAPQIAAPVVTAVADIPADEITDAAATTTLPTDSAAAEQDEAARKKAFEDEVNRRLQDEVARLQSEYERQLSAERSRINAERQKQEPAQQPAPRVAKSEPTPPPPAAATQPAAALNADSLNQQRLEQIETSREATVAQSAPSTAATTQAAQQAADVPAVPPAPTTRQGDLIDLSAVDKPPTLVKAVAPAYPMIARKQKYEATVIISALVSENGDVLDARVLRGDPRGVGFDEAAVAAAKASKFSPPMKDGQRVRTWIAYPYKFQLPR